MKRNELIPVMHSSCLTIKGFRRTIILDINRSCIDTIPNSLYYIIKEYFGAYSLRQMKPDCKQISIDSLLLSEVNNSTQSIYYLETLLGQMNSLSIAMDKDYLLNFLASENNFSNDYKTLTAIYKNENIDELYKFIYNADKTSETYIELLLNDRNAIWMKKIPAILTENRIFIAVGAAHLVGDSGLINLLRLQGYEVKPIKK